MLIEKLGVIGRSRGRKALLMGLAVVVVFVTTYLLILPAITVERDKADELGIKTEEPLTEEVTMEEENTEEQEPAEEPEEVKEPETAEAVEEPKAPEAAEEPKATKEADVQETGDSGTAETKPKKPDDSKKESSEHHDPGTLTAEGEGLTATVTYSSKAGIPEDASLDVREIKTDTKEYDKYVQRAAEAVQEADHSSSVPEVTSSKVFALKLQDADGNAIQPEEPVKVEIEYDKAKPPADGTSLNAVGFGDKEPVVFDTEVQEKDKKIEGLKFEAEKVSVCAIVETKVITIDYLSSNGATYEVSVDIPEKANVPEGSELMVTELSKGSSRYADYLNQTAAALRVESDDLQYVKLLDISIVKDGEKLQPEAPVNVSIKLKDKKDLSKTQIIHFTEKPVVMNANAEGDALRFETPGFSIYAVVDDPQSEYRRMKVEFYNYDGSPITSMIVKNNDSEEDLKMILYDPGTGTVPDGTIFKGWWRGDSANYTASQSDIDQAKTIKDIREWVAGYDFPAPESDGEIPVIKYYAMVYKYHNVTYYGDDSEISLGTHTAYALPSGDETPYTVSMAYTPDANQNFKGWRPSTETADHIVTGQTDDGVYPNGTEITIDGDVVFHVEAPEGNWLVYHQNGKGASYNAPQFYEAGETTFPAANANPPVRSGYTFGGWYTGVSGEPDSTGYAPVDESKPFTFGSELTENTEIYAKWTPNTTAPYTVICWTQNADRTGYDLAGSYIGTGRVGNPIPYTFQNNGDEDYISGIGNNGHYTGFSVKYDNGVPLDAAGQPEVIPTVTPEGDAVLNLYYDRIQYNLRIYLYRKGTGNNGYQYAQNSNAGKNVWNIATWYGATNLNSMPTTTYGPIKSEVVDGYTGYYIELSAYYGEDISSRWPRYDQISSPANNRSPVSFVMMNGTGLKGNGLNDNGYGSGRDTIKGLITIMDEMILGKTNDADGNYLIVRFNTYNSWRYHIWFEAVDGQAPAGKQTHEYNGKLYYEETVLESRSSNTDVAQQNPPQYPGYEYITRRNQYWNGNDRWTTGNNPTLYHINYVYDRLKYNINYMDGVYVDGNGNLIQSRASELLEENEESIEQGAVIPNQYREYVPDLPEGEEGYVFEGWYIDEACITPYTWTTMPVGGITVHAKWRQIQYRVFMHPNAGTDPTLNWGSSSQQMNYRISYGDKVSLPSGTRTGYEFIGWFTDPACTQVYSDSTELNEVTVTAEYDKTLPENYTDVMDKWGNGATYNNDLDRPWITKKLDLYGKWRKILVGADGIDVVYSAEDLEEGVTGTNEPTDAMKYLDNAAAVAKPACTAPEGYVFDYWVVQRWDEESESFVDTDVIAYPGDSFVVKVDDALREEKPDHTPEKPSYQYTIRVHAKYAKAEHETPTFIPWYGNNESEKSGGEDFVVREENIDINEAQPIMPADTFTYDGYRFVGWARVAISDDEGHSTLEALETKLDGSSTNDYDPLLFLEYREDGNFYSTAATIGHGVDAAGVKINAIAPDESYPYHAMVAVWERVYPVTVIKHVVGAELSSSFTFTPNFSAYSAEAYHAAFLLSGEPGSNSKVFESLPGNSTFTITEEENTDFVTTVKYSVDADGTEHDITNQAIANGEEITVTGAVTVEFTNTGKTYPVTVKKVDQDTGEVLPNAVFALTRKNAGDIYVPYGTESNPDGIYTTNEDGEIALQLPKGDYQLEEQAAPAGYVITDKFVRFTVSEPGAVTVTQGSHTSLDGTTLTVTNEPGVELPHTGGPGTAGITAVGALLLLASLTALLLRRRRA